MTLFGAGGSRFRPPEWVASNRAWLDSLTVARDPEPAADSGPADGAGGKVYTFHGMNPHSAARMVARIEARRELERSATTEIATLALLPAPHAATDVQRPPQLGLQFVNGPWEPSDDGTPAPYKPTLPNPSTPPAPANTPSPLEPVEPTSPAPTDGRNNLPEQQSQSVPTQPNPADPAPGSTQPNNSIGPDLGQQPVEVGVDPDGNPQLVLPVEGPDGISHIELGADGTYWVVDPDGTRTPVNSYGIAPPRRTHANQMFDPYTGRWITPPQNPTGLAPENRSPFREAITSTLSTQLSDPTSRNASPPPEIVVHTDGSKEVRVTHGGSDGADRPWTDVRVIDTDGNEIAHYREGIDGNRHYPLGAGHSVTITPDGKVLDPPHVDRSALYSLTAPDGGNRIGYIEHDGWTTALEPIPLPPGVPGQALYAHAGRLIIRDTNGEYHWVDATPETPPPTPAQRSIDLPWDGGDTNSYQGPDGTWYYNVNGHKVAFTPDQQQVITPANGLRPTGTGGIYQDDRPGYGPASGSLLRAAFPIPSKQIPIPEGVPAVALFELEDGRLVIIDKSGGNHYVSPLPAPPPEGWQAGLIRVFMNIASAYGGRRGGWANPERPPLGGGPTTRNSTLDELNATFGRPPSRQTAIDAGRPLPEPRTIATHVDSTLHSSQSETRVSRPQPDISASARSYDKEGTPDAGNPAPTPQRRRPDEVIPPRSRDEASTGAEIQAYMANRYKVIVLGFDEPGLPVASLKEIARAVDDVVARHPGLKMPRAISITDMIDKDKHPYAAVKSDQNTDGNWTPVTMNFSRDFLLDPKRMQQLAENEVHSGHSPSGYDKSPWYSVGVHELAHVIDSWGNWRASDSALAVLQDYFLQNVSKANNAAEMKIEWRQWIRQLSGYSFEGGYRAKLAGGEAVAEAMMDVILNGSNASEPAKVLYKLLTESKMTE